MILTWIFSALVAAVGAGGTYWLIHKKHMAPIRASSGFTLLVAGLFWLKGPALFPFSTLFFGATFVGMTDHSRLGLKRVLLTSQVFVLFYLLLTYLISGLGGSLGAAAFISCCLVYEISKRIKTPSS